MMRKGQDEATMCWIRGDPRGGEVRKDVHSPRRRKPSESRGTRDIDSLKLVTVVSKSEGEEAKIGCGKRAGRQTHR